MNALRGPLVGRRGATPHLAEAYKPQVWTAHHWQHWLGRGRFPDHPWRSYLQRSALTLKGLTYSPTGAIAAAGSTSLPETLGGERNYDYRYTWIRDATFALWGMYSRLRLGGGRLPLFHRRLASRRRRPADHVRHRWRAGAPGVRARPPAGLRRSRPVRIGNAAYTQNQHDVWGALLDSVYLHFKAADHVDGGIWPILGKQVARR